MSEQWQTIVSADQKRASFNLKEILQYKDLVFLYIKRSFMTSYRQTILGPFWIIINPLFSTIVYTLIFGSVAKISTDTLPKFVFYMIGNTTWSLFSTTVTHNSNVFRANSNIFEKVYFPRIIMPISSAISGLLNYFIQFALFLVFWAYYLFFGSYQPTIVLLLIPFLWIEILVLGTGIGLVISAVTRRFRDLQMAAEFGLSLMVYLTPVVYPISEAGGYFRLALLINPMGPIIEAFRYAFFGIGAFEVPFLFLGLAETILICWLGVYLFSKTDRMIMDTI